MIVLLVYTLLGTTTATTTTVTTTATTNSCRFRNEKGVIDITSLGLTNGQPKYPDRVPPTGSNYSIFNFVCRFFKLFFFVL